VSAVAAILRLYGREPGNILWMTVHMETVQIVIDKELLQATDRVAKRTKQSRSALVRDALRAHLRGLEIRASEEGIAQRANLHSH